MSKLKFVLFTSSLLLVAGQALAAPTHLPRVGRTAVEQRLDHQAKAHTGHGSVHHGHQKRHQM
jgi:hypothetical protein